MALRALPRLDVLRGHVLPSDLEAWHDGEGDWLVRGRRCTLQGLTSKKGRLLNGKQGLVLQEQKGGRCEVQLELPQGPAVVAVPREHVVAEARELPVFAAAACWGQTELLLRFIEPRFRWLAKALAKGTWEEFVVPDADAVEQALGSVVQVTRLRELRDGTVVVQGELRGRVQLTRVREQQVADGQGLTFAEVAGTDLPHAVELGAGPGPLRVADE